MAHHHAPHVPLPQQIDDSLSLVRWSLGLAATGAAMGLVSRFPGWPWPVAGTFGWAFSCLGLVLAFLLLVLARRDRLRHAHALRHDAARVGAHGQP